MPEFHGVQHENHVEHTGAGGDTSGGLGHHIADAQPSLPREPPHHLQALDNLHPLDVQTLHGIALAPKEPRSAGQSGDKHPLQNYVRFHDRQVPTSRPADLSVAAERDKLSSWFSQYWLPAAASRPACRSLKPGQELGAIVLMS